MSEIDQPFSLRRRFEQLVLPPLLLGLGIFLWSVYAQEKTMSERVYVELVRNHLQTIVDDALSHDEQLLNLLLERDNSDEGLATSLQNFKQRLIRESALQDYLCISFIVSDGRRLVDVSNDSSCRAVEHTVLVRAAMDQRGSLIEDFPRMDVRTVVVPLRVIEESVDIVAVVTKPTPLTENNHHQSFKLWAVVAFFALSFAILVAWLLIRGAQKLIDQQVVDLIRLRNQLSRYVSGGTVRAVMGSDKNDLPSSRSLMTLLFVDVRHFSSYAESANLDDIVTLLNDVTSIIVSAVTTNHGDVDKVVGDGVLATFSGKERKTHALHAAIEIVEKITSADYARTVGLGVHDGEVVSATIGRGKRRDHTVLGRAVNQASRLCSMAGPGEILAASDTIPSESEFDRHFGREETLCLKGHTDPVRVRKYKPSARL